MGRLFPFLVLSQISNMAPLAGFLIYSTTVEFADYLFCLLLGQLLWPLMTLRLDIQLQIELYRSRQDYVFGLVIWVLIAFTLIGAALLYLWRGVPVLDNVLDQMWGGMFLGAALALASCVRAYFVARGNTKLLMGFETANIVKNAATIWLAAWVAQHSLLADFKQIFVWTNVIFALMTTLGLLVWLRNKPTPRVLISLIALWQIKTGTMRTRARRVFLYSFPNSFVGMATGRLPLLAMEAMLAAPLSAAFLAANRLTLSPLTFLIFAFRVSAVLELNKGSNNLPNRFRYFFWIIVGLGPVLLSPMILPAFVPGIYDPILRYFDPSWSVAAAFLPMTYPWAVLFFITGWMDRVFDITGQQHLVLIIEIVMLCLAALMSWAIFASWLTGMSTLWAIIAFGCVHALAWLSLFFWKEFRNVV